MEKGTKAKPNHQRNLRLELRMSQIEMDMLDAYAKAINKNRSEAIREAISMMYIYVRTENQTEN